MAQLLEVVRIKLQQCHPSFIDYDTDSGAFCLPPKGSYLMLLFKKPGGSEADLFTTLRSYRAEKERYYRAKRGEWFDVIISGQSAANPTMDAVQHKNSVPKINTTLGCPDPDLFDEFKNR